MSRPALPCSRPGCARTTTDPSGRCHDHRGAPTLATIFPPPPPPAPSSPSDHREDPNGLTVIRKNGVPLHEVYRKNGVVHRVGGPARTFFHSNGVPKHTLYAERGKTHRQDGPAFIGRSADGSITEEIYYRRGLKSRLDGPAHLHYAPDGTLERANYFFRGKAYRNHEALYAAYSVLRWKAKETELRGSAFGVLLREGHTTEELAKILRAGLRTVEGVRAVFEGAPVEWAKSFEQSSEG